jgi:Uncharacterized protein conserved in bacteria
MRKCICSLCLLLPLLAQAQYDGKHEWRAAWIATVNNIDWPARSNLSAERQQADLLAYLDLFKSLNFNAIVFQARPTADAFYASELEPWSLYLTGKQGQAPQPFYDPLAFLTEEAHKRGMEVHVWLNPYRLTQDTTNLKDAAPGHIYRQHPEWFQSHGRKGYFDPALPQTRDFLCKVVADILRRYDVDGIHMDDYFYPNSDFEDAASFAKYGQGYTAENKMDWRRENVNMVIRQLRDTIKSIKPYVKFGISPFAVWRNKREDPRGSDTKVYGYTNYDHLHADVLKWMEEGWVDYMLPQLYFQIGHPTADFLTLAQWWEDNRGEPGLYAGLGTYKLDARSAEKEWHSSDEILRQIDDIRARAGYSGLCYYSAKNFRDNRLGIVEAVATRYPRPALVPPLPGFSTQAPAAPTAVQLVNQNENYTFSWAVSQTTDELPASKYYAVYKFPKGQTPDFSKGEALVWLGGETAFACTKEEGDKYDFYLTALDRLYNESEAVFMQSK